MAISPIGLLFPIVIGIVLVSFCVSLWMSLREGIAHVKRLHQIPCSRCAFYTGDYRLKCTVHPCKALSEEALNCLDYEPATTLPIPRSPVKFAKKSPHSCTH